MEGGLVWETVFNLNFGFERLGVFRKGIGMDGLESISFSGFFGWCLRWEEMGGGFIWGGGWCGGLFMVCFFF